MNKSKIVSIMIIGMLVSLASVSFVSAEEKELQGNIKAEFVSTVIEPTLNIVQNQTVHIDVEEEDGNYSVNTTLLINVTTVGDVPETLFFRGLITSVFMIRNDYSMFKPNWGIFHPLLKPGGKILKFNLISLSGMNFLSHPTKYVELPLKYDLNRTTDLRENVTMFVGVMSFLPGEVHTTYPEPDGFLYSAVKGFMPKFMGVEQVNLEIVYDY